MPFVGGYIGYHLAPEKIIEVPVPETHSPEEAVSVASAPIEQSEFTDVELPQVEWKDNQNDYTVVERSQYRAIANGERIASFFYQRNDGTLFVEDMRNLDGSGAHIPLAQADVATFEINTLWPSYARDKNHVYILGKVIEGADPKTFIPVCGFSPGTASTCGFSKDADHVYWYTKPITGADVTTFAFLHGGKDYPSFAIDKSSVYRGEYSYPDTSSSSEIVKIDSIKKFSNGSLISFAQTKDMKVGELDTWAPYLTDKNYTDGEYNYVEDVTFTDGTNSYSLYEKSKPTEQWDGTLYLSKVQKMGDKPAEVK